MVNGIVSFISLSDLSLLVYRNARDFCVLILYLATLLNSLMSSSNFLVVSLGLFYVLNHVICKQWQFYFFLLIWISFISFSCLNAVVKTSHIMLNKSGERGHPSLVLILDKTLSSFQCFVWCWLHICRVRACLISCVQLSATLWTLAHQPPQSKGFSRQEYWRGLPCSPPGDPPDSEVELHCWWIL